MPDSPAAERRNDHVYASIRAMVVSHELPPRQRIRVEPLADGLRVSNTPVREALIRLAAERIVDEIPNAGFFTKDIAEPEVRELIKLGGMLLDWSLTLVRPLGQVPGMLKPPKLFETAAALPPAGAVELMDALFLHIARQSGNADLVQTIDNINARTFYVRLKDCELVEDVSATAARLCRTYAALDIAGLRAALQQFHGDLLARLPDIIRLIAQARAEAGRHGDTAAPSRRQAS